MRAKFKYAITAGHAASTGSRHANAANFRRGSGRSLAVLGIALLMVTMLSVGQIRAATQDGRSDDNLLQNLDSRWIPWIGSWRLISSVDRAGSVVEISKNILEINPGNNRSAVVMKGIQDEEVLYEEKNVIVDGSRHPIEDDGCEGWYKYSWSDTGKRLLFDSEVTCSDNGLRTISGMSAFTDPSEWVDVQLLISGEDRMITIRRYRQGDDSQDLPVPRSKSHFARVEAGTNFTVEEIIELTDKVAPEVVEASLMEMRKPFDINSKVLLRLADADVPSQVVDLMVAISFPDKFTIARYNVEPAEEPASGQYDTPIVYPYAWSPFGIWSYYDPFFPWYWRTPSYLYGYWGWGSYYPVYWGSPDSGGGGYRISGGRLVAGQGYSRVTPGRSSAQPRYAQRRGSSRTVSRAGGVSAGTYSGGGYSGGGSSGSSGGGSSGGYSGGSSGGSSGGASASPGGYSSGGRGGGGTARGR